MTFSEALNYLKCGRKISRSGWNGKEQYIELGSNISYMRPNGEIINANNITMGSRVIVFHGTMGEQVGWLASQGDLLSNDWQVIPD